MQAETQKVISFTVLNSIITILLGACCFSAFAAFIGIYGRQTGAWDLPPVSFAESILGALSGLFIVFSLACVFGTLIFIVPGIIQSVLLALASIRLTSYPRFMLSALAALLGSVIFPLWLFLYPNPLQKEWPMISGIAALACAVAASISHSIVSRRFASRYLTPPPLPRA